MSQSDQRDTGRPSQYEITSPSPCLTIRYLHLFTLPETWLCPEDTASLATLSGQLEVLIRAILTQASRLHHLKCHRSPWQREAQGHDTRRGHFCRSPSSQTTVLLYARAEKTPSQTTKVPSGCLTWVQGVSAPILRPEGKE